MRKSAREVQEIRKEDYPTAQRLEPPLAAIVRDNERFATPLELPVGSVVQLTWGDTDGTYATDLSGTWGFLGSAYELIEEGAECPD